MKAKLSRTIWLALSLIMTLALSVNSVLAQEETAESNGGIGWIIFILGFGVLVVLGLGLAMNAQNNDENASQE